MLWKIIVSRSSIEKVFRFRKSLISIVAVPAIALGLYRMSRYSTIQTTFIAPQQAPSWNWSPEQIVEDANTLIDDSNKFYNALVQVDLPSIENLIKPYMQHENKIGLLINQLTFLQHVSGNQEIRNASVTAAELLQNFEIESSLRHDLFLRFDEVWKQLKDRKSEYQIDPKNFELYRFVEKCHNDYVRAGLNLPEEGRDKVKQIKIKIAANSLQFSKNLGEQKEYIAFTKQELDGVSESLLEQFEKIVDQKNGVDKYKVTFKYPDILPVLKTAKNPNTRKKAFLGDQNKVSANEALLLDTLKLRKELALLLGFSTYANYNLENKMAKKQEVVLEFLKDLKEKLRPLAIKELDLLKQVKKEECKQIGVPYDGHYYVWDHRYYDNKILKDNYNVDLETISDYYPLNSAITGMLTIYEKLLKLKFVEETDPAKKSVWHEDVKQLAVWGMDNENKPEFIGWIYFDLHPRDGKYGHAANFGISSSYVAENGKRSYPITALVCNFSKATPKKPSLLKHHELTTFFHELGHGIHDLVGKNSAARFNGPSSVPWDFVEAPSQMLEFWTWNKYELSSLSSHYEKGDRISDDLLNSLIATKHVNGALAALRQLHFSLFDMTVHTSEDPKVLDLLRLWNEMREEISLVENGDELTKGYGSFGHIMSDSYSAGYYGYMWAEVFATDMYYTKFAHNPLDSVIGTQYRDIILSRGGLYEIGDNLREFLGREPSKEAFLRELGIK